MDDKTYRRLFCETPCQMRIRHNFPYLNHMMTKAERKQYEEIIASLGHKKGDVA